MSKVSKKSRWLVRGAHVVGEELNLNCEDLGCTRNASYPPRVCRVPINLAWGKQATTRCAVDNVLTIEVLLDALLKRIRAQHCGRTNSFGCGTRFWSQLLTMWSYNFDTTHTYIRTHMRLIVGEPSPHVYT